MTATRIPPIDPALEPVWLPHGRKSHPKEKKDQLLTEAEQRRSVLAYCADRIKAAGRGRIGTWRFDDQTGLTAARPHYQATLEEARQLRRAGHAVFVACRQLDRLGRNGEELFRAKDEFTTSGVELHDVSMGGQIAPQVFPYLVGNAVVGSVTISMNVKRVNTDLRRQGWWKPGRPSWGYRMRKATAKELAAGSPKAVLDVKRAEADSAREAWQRRAAGESVHQIGRWAAGLSDAARGGRVLPHNFLRAMFRSRTYLGQQPDGAPGRWPALVDQATWDRVQERVRQDQRVPAQGTGDFLLTGLAYCSVCGARMRAWSAKDRHGDTVHVRRRYMCSSSLRGAKYPKPCYFSIPVEVAEPLAIAKVAPLLEAFLQHRSRIIRAIKVALAAPPKTPRQAALAAADAEIARVDRLSGALALKLADGKLTDAEYAAAVEPLRAKRANAVGARARALEALGPRAEDRTHEIKLADVVALLDDLLLRWQREDVAERREVLCVLAERVTPTRDDAGYDVTIAPTFIGHVLAEAVNATAG